MPETQEDQSLPGILADIVRTKKEDLQGLLSSASALEQAAEAAPEPRGFELAIAQPGFVSLIAECKRRSPGSGQIRPNLDPARLASDYEKSGAAALSVLTDDRYFGGSLADLEAVRCATSIPVLRKDFTLDTLHLLEARVGGADAILLIVRILDEPQLDRLYHEAIGFGLDVVVEVHNIGELESALKLDASIIGINNRDLATFETDLETTEWLLESVPSDVVIVSESGIRTRGDVERLAHVGVDAMLVGEALLSVTDPAVAVATLCGVPTEARVSSL